MRHLRIVPDHTTFSFMRFRRISVPVSAVLSICSVLAVVFIGLNFGIDFKGGTLMDVATEHGQMDVAKVRATMTGLNLGDVQIQEFATGTEAMIRVAEQPGGDAAQQTVVTKVKAALGKGYVYRQVQVVGPRVSKELVSYGTLGVVLAIGAILIYLWFRFEWQFALGAMIANSHDLILTLGFMAVTQLDFDLTSVAAMLTILGYSLNDTVVIYDRIREILRRSKRVPIEIVLDQAINATLSRSVVTHVTVTFSLLALLLFGGAAIHSFTATMMFGAVLVGSYTSIFIASPMLIYLGLRTSQALPAEDPAAEAAPASSRRRANSAARKRAGSQV